MHFRGMVAGVLSRFGKIGVILGFIAGNVILSYVSTGYAVQAIYIKEIVLASLGLLLVPKKIQINIEDFFGKDLCLPVGTAHMLETAETDTIYKLNTVSETISEMSRNYKEASREKESETKNVFIETLEEKLENLQENILYEDLVENENGLATEIFEILLEKNVINKEDILNLLEKRNEYITGFEDFDTNMKVEEDINSVLRIINDTYKIGKINNLWKQRMKENKKVISSQLDGVSKAISSVAQSINSKSKENFEKEKKEINILCMQKEIKLSEINIEQNKNGRYSVSLCVNSTLEDKECEQTELENLLSKVLKTRNYATKKN
ncbi:MAG: hypothetical protein HFJ50_04685 [Clostridia bacterium]|nr:hypothetical protein [Clostridia bacterium]